MQTVVSISVRLHPRNLSCEAGPRGDNPAPGVQRPPGYRPATPPRERQMLCRPVTDFVTTTGPLLEALDRRKEFLQLRDLG